MLADEEIKAVKVMNAALAANPQSYPILHAQVDFLLSKHKYEWAQQVAQQAVNSAPSEFTTWAKLTETYIELGQLDQALLTLNSCPMFTYNERDLHRMPTPAKSNMPVKKFIADSNLVDEDSSRENEVRCNLQFFSILPIRADQVTGRYRSPPSPRSQPPRHIRQSVLPPHSPCL